MPNQDDEILLFIASVLESAKNSTLTQSQRLLLIEFYTRYQYTTDTNTGANFETASDADILKYLTMGWYVYSNIVNKPA